MRRIFWFSPVPPSRTDIANYSNRLFKYLNDLVDLVVLCPDGTECDADAYGVKIRRISSVTSLELNGADVCIYNIGNNADFHSQIFEMLTLHPGVAILHDKCLLEFFLGYLGLNNGTAISALDLRVSMGQWYGGEGLRKAVDLLKGHESASAVAERFPLYEIIADRSLAVICHNDEIFDEIRNKYPFFPVKFLSLPYPSLGDLGCPSLQTGKVKFVAFGFMGGNRRLREFLAAWAESRWKHNFELDIAGVLESVDDLKRELATLGLAEQVRLHGFLSEEQLNALIRDSHLAINLRYPTMGEASGSQLRIWYNGKASIVTDVGWYSRLPDDAVIKISPDKEHESLLDLFELLANGKIDLIRMGCAGAEHLKAHCPRQYAIDLVDWLFQNKYKFINEWSRRRALARIAAVQGEVSDLDVIMPSPKIG